MKNFDIRSFLLENELTPSSRLVAEDENMYDKYYTKCSSADEVLKEIEVDLRKATMESKLEILGNVVDAYERKISTLEEDENLKGFVNSSKLKEMRRTCKKLTKEQEKLHKEYNSKYSNDDN